MSDVAGEDGKPLPDSMTLKPDRLRWLFIFLTSLGFVGIFIWLLQGGGGDLDYKGQRVSRDSALFWAGGGFFALGALIAIPPMFGVGSSLTLDRKGFSCRTLFRTFQRDWLECSAFYPVRIARRKFVGFSTERDEAAHPTLAAANRARIGASGMLPDTFGLSAEGLSDLMNRYRARARDIVDKGQD